MRQMEEDEEESEEETEENEMSEIEEQIMKRHKEWQKKKLKSA